MRGLFALLGLVAATIWLGCKPSILEPASPPAAPGHSDIIASGSYDVRFVATQGSRAGSEMTGRLVLKQTPGQARSPELIPPGTDIFARTPLYGWFEGDLRTVGAPIVLGDPVAPDPDSRDPIRPGVLVHIRGQSSGSPRAMPYLTVGTLANLRDGSMWVDGAGISLRVNAADPTGFDGEWGGYGIVADGSGRYWAKRVSP